MTSKSDIASKSLYNFTVEYIGKEGQTVLGLVLALIRYLKTTTHATKTTNTKSQAQNPIVKNLKEFLIRLITT